MGLANQPRIATYGAHDPNEKIPEPYRTIRTILLFLYESAIRGGSAHLLTGIRTAVVSYESTPASSHIIT